MSNFEKLEDLKLAKEFPPTRKDVPTVVIYEEDFDWLMKQAEQIQRIKKETEERLRNARNLDEHDVVFELENILETLNDDSSS